MHSTDIPGAGLRLFPVRAMLLTTARIDGASHLRIFLQVILPLMVPALATTGIK